MTTNTFIAGKGFLYRFDPRAKLLLLVLLCAFVFLPVSMPGLWLVVAAVFLSTWSSTGFKQALHPLRSILPLLIIMVVFIPITHRDSGVLLSISGFPLVTTGALENFNLLAARFIGITYMCTLFFWTTPMGDIMLTLRWYGLSHKAALVLTLAFRFIPFIADAFQMIQDSHSMREPNLGEQDRRRQPLADVVPTVTSALVFALKSIPQLAMSLEHRGFGRAGARSAYRRLAPRKGLFTHFFFSVMIPTSLWLVFNTLG
jgi:energy-coupling factor transport system permease protein